MSPETGQRRGQGEGGQMMVWTGPLEAESEAVEQLDPLRYRWTAVVSLCLY